MDKCDMDPVMMPECCAQWRMNGRCEGNGTCPYRVEDPGSRDAGVDTLTVCDRIVRVEQGLVCDCTFWPCSNCPACIENRDCCPLEPHLIYRSIDQDPEHMSRKELEQAYRSLLLKAKRADAMLTEVWGAYNRIGDALKEKP